MNSLEVMSFKKSLEDYINNQTMPKEVIRLVLKEIYLGAEKSAIEEALMQAKEKEKEDVTTKL